jgi:L-lactate permease
MMMACGILGAALRFYESEHLKIVLYGQVLALFVSQIMLAGSQGEMIDETQTQAGVIGTFVSILVGIVGAFS